jgi:glycosyltransferase involved in cell wall biosynthesis
MRIGFDAKRALFNRSGLGNYSRSTVRLLSDFYPENNYFLFSGKSNSELYHPSGNQKIVEPESKIYKSLPQLWRSWGINNQISKLRIDIYHGLSNELPFSIQKTKVKSVVTIHDLIFLRYPEYYPFIDRKIYRYKFSHACRVADKIIATSESTKQDIMTYFGTDPGKIEVVYQTCDPVFSVPVSDVKKAEICSKYDLPEQFILSLGTIEKRKNVLSLIKAYFQENIAIPLVIAGKPTSYLNEINEYLKDNPAGRRIIFRHSIKSDDLPALYQMASVFAYPSVFEGFGIPILEALYSGVPVITSNGSCFSETGGNAAMYCDPFDTTQLGKCISQVLNDSITRKSMIEKGFAHSKLFDEAKVAANLMSVYQKL